VKEGIVPVGKTNEGFFENGGLSKMLQAIERACGDIGADGFGDELI